MNLVSNAAVFSPLRAERTQEERMQMHTAKLDGQRLCPRFCEISPSGVGKGGSLRSESLPTMASTAAEPNHENEARKLHEELFPSGLLQELPDYMLPVGHRVWTRMGRGTVAHNRSDGFQEIELDWTLAGNCKVYLYTNEMLETLFLANSNLEQEPSEDSWADYTNATPFEQFVTDAEFLLKDLGFENKLVVPQPVSPEVQTVPLKYDGVEWNAHESWFDEFQTVIEMQGNAIGLTEACSGPWLMLVCNAYYPPCTTDGEPMRVCKDFCHELKEDNQFCKAPWDSMSSYGLGGHIPDCDEDVVGDQDSITML